MEPLLVNLRTTVIGVRPPLDLSLFRPDDKTSLEQAYNGTRQVYFDGDWHETAIYRRDALPTGARLADPPSSNSSTPRW